MLVTPTDDELFEQQMKNLREAARSMRFRDRPDRDDIIDSCRWAESRLRRYREQESAAATCNGEPRAVVVAAVTTAF